MRSHFSHEIQFVKYRKVFLAIAIACIVLSIVGLLVRGLNFGIEFIGGTQVNFTDAGDVTISQMRDAMSANGESQAVIQSTSNSNGANGYMVRTSETDPVAANQLASAVAEHFGFAQQSYQVQTIGPNWGSDVTKSMAIAFVVVIALIIAFVSIRYEFKMSLIAAGSLILVILTVVGIYAWTQFEVTPNVVAAILTIMGYCLYDTVVVFNRVNENINELKDGKHRTALQITNYSVNQVVVRSINTTLTSVFPVLCMLIFGGETLKGFAFAMIVGLVLGSCSSIMLSAPLYAMWKGREDRWRKAEEHYGENSQAR